MDLVNNYGREESSFRRVRDINWTDTEIDRAGITPIYYDGIFSWIGLSISRFSASLACIGGSFDKRIDFDLLSTAVREYNEEIGYHLETVTESDVINCYAIVSKQTIQILYPVSKRTSPFLGNSELYDFIWVTPNQLLSMYHNNDYNLDRKTKAYSMTPSFKSVILRTVAAVRSGIPFQLEDNPAAITRDIRRKKEPKFIIKRSLLEFLSDFNKLGGWYWVTLSVGDTHFGVMRYDLTVYYLPLADINTVLLTLARKKIKIYISTNEADRKIRQAYPIEQNVSMEAVYQSYYDRYNKDKDIMVTKNKFLSDLESIRNLDQENRIINECYIMVESEKYMYAFVERTNLYFNSYRACFLKGLGVINWLLGEDKGSLQEDKLLLLMNPYMNCQAPNDKIIMDILVSTRIIIRSNTDKILLPVTL